MELLPAAAAVQVNVMLLPVIEDERTFVGFPGNSVEVESVYI